MTSTSTFFQRSSQLSILNHPLRLLMAIAFNFDVNQMGARIVGLPGWADNDGETGPVEVIVVDRVERPTPD